MNADRFSCPDKHWWLWLLTRHDPNPEALELIVTNLINSECYLLLLGKSLSDFSQRIRVFQHTAVTVYSFNPERLDTPSNKILLLKHIDTFGNSNSLMKVVAFNSLRNYSYYVQQFCSTTSIHGLKFLGEGNRCLIEKLWWFIVLIFATTGSTLLIYKSYAKWKTSPIVVTLAMAETPIWQIPFPAVTICPEIKSDSKIFNYTDIYLKYKLNKSITKDEEENLQLFSLVCESNVSGKGVEYFGRRQISKLISMLGVTTTESCKWAGRELNCSSVLEPMITMEGICETFNMLPLPEIIESHVDNNLGTNTMKDRSFGNQKSETYPRKSTLPGIKSGFQIDLYVNGDDFDYSCKEIQGFKVSLHHPYEMPDLVNYFRVPLDEVVVTAVKPNMITTSDDLSNYSPHVRQCYLPNEIKLNSFKMYSQNNCIVECLSRYLIKKCGCTMMYLPNQDNAKFCGPGKLECVRHYQAFLLENGTDPNSKNKFYCGCLPLCTSLSFDAETSQTDWNWKKTYKLQKNSTIDNLDYRTSHFSRLIIFYKNIQFMSIERHEVYGFMEFWANCGGLLGLFLGFSFTSSMEILYFLTLRLFCNIKKFGLLLWSGIPLLHEEDTIESGY